jgi:hypothetical protein
MRRRTPPHSTSFTAMIAKQVCSETTKESGRCKARERFACKLPDSLMLSPSFLYRE